MRHKEDIRNIYRAALAEFGKSGYQRATMEAIAARLSMTKGNLYIYVKNKQSLYRESVAWALKNWQDQVRRAVIEASDAREKFRILCVRAVDYLSQDRDFQRVLVRDPDIFPLFSDNDPFGEINDGSVDLIREILEAGAEEKNFRRVDARRMAQVLFMIYKMFIIRWYIQGKEAAMQEVFDETLDLITHGLFLKDS